MNVKKILLVSAILALIAGSFGTVLAQENGRRDRDDDDRIRIRVREDQLIGKMIRGSFNSTVTLNNSANTAASGTARFRVAKTGGGLFSANVRIRVDNEQLAADQVLEGWLADNDTGYKLSLGGFRVNASGRGNLQFWSNLVNFPLYNKVMVTEEPLNDSNPNPAKTILEASIPSSFNTISFRAILSGANEVPANDSRARGTANFVLNIKDNALSFDISFRDLSGAETGAHIHGPAAAGQNAAVLFALPAGSPKTGVWNYDPSLEADILAGRTYVNIHSMVFPNGEIRAQLKP